MKKQILNIAFAGVMGISFLCAANAAPTVRKLGTASTNVVRNDGVAKSGSSTTSARVSSVRATPKAVVAKVPTSASTSKVVSAPTDGDTARLSLGKYLHGTNVVKSNAAASAATVAADEVVVLKDRVSAVEQDVAEQKDALDTKQDKLIAGEGIKIENNVIEYSGLIPSEEGGIPTYPIWME